MNLRETTVKRFLSPLLLPVVSSWVTGPRGLAQSPACNTQAQEAQQARAGQWSYREQITGLTHGSMPSRFCLEMRKGDST